MCNILLITLNFLFLFPSSLRAIETFYVEFGEQREGVHYCEVIKYKITEPGDQVISSRIEGPIYHIEYTTPEELTCLLETADLRLIKEQGSASVVVSEQIRMRIALENFMRSAQQLSLTLASVQSAPDLPQMISSRAFASLPLSSLPILEPVYEPGSLLSQFKEYGFTIRGGNLELESTFDPEKCTLVSNREIKNSLWLDEKARYQGKFLNKEGEHSAICLLFACHSSHMPKGSAVRDFLKQITTPSMGHEGQDPLKGFTRTVIGDTEEKTLTTLEATQDPLILHVGNVTTRLTMASFGFFPTISDGSYEVYQNQGLITEYFITTSHWLNTPNTARNLLERTLSQDLVEDLLRRSIETIRTKMKESLELSSAIIRLDCSRLHSGSEFIHLLAHRLTLDGRSQALSQSAMVFLLKNLLKKQAQLSAIALTADKDASSAQTSSQAREELRVIEQLLSQKKGLRGADEDWGQPETDEVV